MTKPKEEGIPKVTRAGHKTSTIRARKTIYWTAGKVPEYEGDDLGEKQM